jgi:hypothetical protein
MGAYWKMVVVHERKEEENEKVIFTMGKVAT